MERSAEVTQAIDEYLASTLRAVMAGNPAPAWPAGWRASPDIAEAFCARVMFHGIALVLLGAPGKLADWPQPVRGALHKEARAQSFWEIGHREVLCRLIETLGAKGSPCTITKGSALAYSVYPEPAWRRRGDSDILVPAESLKVGRKGVRRALQAAGFRRVGDARPLQESWASACSLGFDHVFDLHWEVNASPVLARGLKRAGVGTRAVALPRLSPKARGIAPTDNLILITINRASHEALGYATGEHKLFERDRLIWALDIDLISRSLAPHDWEALLAATAASGTGPLVGDALAFAVRTLGTAVPEAVKQGLAAQTGDPAMLGYFAQMSGIERLRRDLAASRGLMAKLHLAGYTLFPGAEVLHERFPDAAHWPLAALQGRRLVAGAGKLISRRS